MKKPVGTQRGASGFARKNQEYVCSKSKLSARERERICTLQKARREVYQMEGNQAKKHEFVRGNAGAEVYLPNTGGGDE